MNPESAPTSDAAREPACSDDRICPHLTGKSDSTDLGKLEG